MLTQADALQEGSLAKISSCMYNLRAIHQAPFTLKYESHHWLFNKQWQQPRTDGV